MTLLAAVIRGLVSPGRVGCVVQVCQRSVVSGQWSVVSETGAVLQFTKDINSDKTSVLALMSGQCRTVKCSAVQCSAVQCSTVQCCVVQCSVVQYSIKS